jgi:hypothetical protein
MFKDVIEEHFYFINSILIFIQVSLQVVKRKEKANLFGHCKTIPILDKTVKCKLEEKNENLRILLFIYFFKLKVRR